MLGLRVERRTFDDRFIPRDIATHMRTFSAVGGAVVVAEYPTHMHAAIRRELQHIALTNAGAVTQSVFFSADTFDTLPASRVTVATPDEFLAAPPGCRTMYVTCPVDKSMLYRITGFMPPNGLVVLYKEPTDA